MRSTRSVLVVCIVVLCVCMGYAQNTNPWPSSGNVGIGTTNPGGKALYVRANSSGDHSAVIENISSTGYGLVLNSAYDPLRVGALGDGNGGYFKVSSNGNVGIGTTAPEMKLDVSGVVRSKYDLRTTVVGTGNGYFADDGVGSTIFSITRQADNETRFQSYGFITFRTLYSGGTERMRITQDGKVGIGITAPYSHSSLHIKAPSTSPWAFLSEANGNDRVIGVGHDGTNGMISVSYLGGSGYTPLVLRTSNVSRMVIGVGGNVGIGTNGEPGVKLEVNGDTNFGTNLPSINGYGSHINFLGASANGDALWMSRFNNGDNLSELRVNIGDDVGQAGDKFVVGTHHWNGGAWNAHLTVQADGNVGIGTGNPGSFRLAVEGKIGAREVNVTTAAWSDYVFNDDYKLPSLSEVQAYIKEHHHLPDVPSEKEVLENGQNLGEMNKVLLKKVEELMLYVIDLEERLSKVENR